MFFVQYSTGRHYGIRNVKRYYLVLTCDPLKVASPGTLRLVLSVA